MSHVVSENYGCNRSCTAMFVKTCGEDTLRCPYKDYNSLNRWQANFVLLAAIFFPVTTHLRQDKKVSILPPGDVNPEPVPSRRGLLEYSLYQAIGIACLSCY
jgi:hypothetical protein